MGLKDRLFYWQLNNRLKTLKRKKRFINLDSAETAGIIWNCGDRTAFESLKKALISKQIKITEFCFSQGSSADNTANIISKDDFNRWGIPKSDNLNEFLNKEFDLFIDISMSSSNMAQVIRALSKASFKIGWADVEPNYFDFSIDISIRREPSYLIEQMVHYLNEIKQK